MGGYRNIVLCGGMGFVVQPPPNERRDLTGREPPPISVPWFQRFSDVIATGRKSCIGLNPNLYAFRLVAGKGRRGPRGSAGTTRCLPPCATRAAGPRDSLSPTPPYP